MTTAGIVIIGDEILSGKFVEENAAFLIGELRALGVELRRIVTIPDALDDIAATVADASARFDHVFTSGGIGPTHDDLTIAGIARGFGVAVVRAPELETRLRAHWGDRLIAANLRLADVPDGAELIFGAGAVWPVVAFQNVYILPGVPTLFRKQFGELRERFRVVPVTTARVYLDADEGEIAAELDAVVAAFPGVKLGSYPRIHETEFKVLVTLEGHEAVDVGAAFGNLVARLGTRVVKAEAPA